MIYVFLFFVFLGLAAFVYKFISFFSGFHEDKPIKKEYFLPYEVHRTMMTEHERMLFENLRTVLGSTYDVYPQMKLDKIFSVNLPNYSKYYLGSLRKINQKSVDFLVVKRDTQSPTFAIELDDFSHENEDRRERDNFVGELFNHCNFPLVRFNPGQYKVEELRVVLGKYIEKS